MSTVEIKTPYGNTIQLNAPDDATPDQIHGAAKAAVAHFVSNSQPTMNPDGLLNQLRMGGRALLAGSQADNTNQIAQEGFNKTGEDIATSKLGQQFPEAGAAVGTAVQMAPTLASLFVGAPEAQGAAKSGQLGMPGRVISGPGRAEAGAAQGLAERAAGINTDYEPTLKTMAQKIGLPKGTTTKDYLNGLMDQIKTGEKFTADEAYQHKKLIGSILDKEYTGVLAKLGLKSEKTIGKSAAALATRLSGYLGDYLNQLSPDRAEAVTNYAAAMKRMNLYKGAVALGSAYVGSPLLKALIKSTSNAGD